MSKRKNPYIRKTFEEIGLNHDFYLDDPSDIIIEDDYSKFSNYVETLFHLTGRRDCAPVTVAQINVLRAQGRQTLKQDLGTHLFLKLHDYHLQVIGISISKIKGQPHYALMLSDQNSFVS